MKKAKKLLPWDQKLFDSQPGRSLKCAPQCDTSRLLGLADSWAETPETPQIQRDRIPKRKGLQARQTCTYLRIVDAFLQSARACPELKILGLSCCVVLDWSLEL